MTQIAFEYTDAASRPADDDAVMERIAATTTARVIARLKAERDEARRQLVDVEERVAVLASELDDARQQHDDDAKALAALRCRIRQLEMFAITVTAPHAVCV